jgi:hypothetical protein
MRHYLPVKGVVLLARCGAELFWQGKLRAFTLTRLRGHRSDILA